MNNLMIGIVVLSIITAILHLGLIIVYAVAIKEIDRKQESYKRELRRMFGWDESEWRYWFDDYKKKVDRATKEIKELNNLDLIKQGKKLATLQKLQREQEETKKEIDKLTGVSDDQ
ncbi:hypothetical protein K6V64_05580 [Streptococcus suis]|nr:hypothetical protein [Streptococcus suis]HEM5914760.1 hypothetical protein [Streptococcus suis]